MNNKYLRIFTVFLSFILVFSVISPSLTSAQTQQADSNLINNSVDSELEISTRALPLAAPILALVIKKAVKEAVEYYGKQAVIDAVMEELDLPKTISGRKLINKLKKVGFEEVRQKGSHVIMRGPNGNTFPIPEHKELASGTYHNIKKNIQDSIAP